jgi:hypothetical protein
VDCIPASGLRAQVPNAGRNRTHVVLLPTFKFPISDSEPVSPTVHATTERRQSRTLRLGPWLLGCLIELRFIKFRFVLFYVESIN